MADVVVPLWAEPRRAVRSTRGRVPAYDIESLYRELAPRVLGFLRANGAPDPEDLLSEVFFQVARDFERFSGGRADRRRWVFGIARHRLIDAWRRRAARPLLADTAVPELESSTSSEPTIDPELVEALRELTDEQREVMVLRFVADLPIRDVAVIVGRDIGAVKSLQRRGIAALQRALDGSPAPADAS